MKVDYANSTKLNNCKKIQPRILLKRTLKKDSQFNELWYISNNKKNTQIQSTLKHFYKKKKKKTKKRKILKLKELWNISTKQKKKKRRKKNTQI